MPLSSWKFWIEMLAIIIVVLGSFSLIVLVGATIIDQIRHPGNTFDKRRQL